MSLQPFAAIVGHIGESVGYYIIVDDVRYKVENIVRCLELLFKLFHAWDIEYPPESENIWIFLQEMAFKMKSCKKNPSTATVMADINFHLGENSDI